MQTAIALSTMLAATQAADWNYATNGADWPDAFPECGATNQSPIDLKTDTSGYQIFGAADDDITKIYSNQYGGTVNWNGHTSQTDLGKDATTDKMTTVNFFKSKIAKNHFGAPDTFEGIQFHFHAGSEHTIDGKRQDLEMHTVHYPKSPEGGFIAAAVGIMFSVNDHNAQLTTEEEDVITAFFDGLKWNDGGDAVVSDMILYGNLMEMVDSNKRWMYKGSVTTPPCATYVYWNVLSTIYPVSQKHLDLFVNTQLVKGEDGELDNRGNWRVTVPEDEHGVIYLDGSSSSSGGGSEGGMMETQVIDNTNYMVAVIILAIVAGVGIIASTLLYFMKANTDKKYEEI